MKIDFQCSHNFLTSLDSCVFAIALGQTEISYQIFAFYVVAYL